MNTLTTFIYQNHTNQPADVTTTSELGNQGNMSEDARYEIIENCTITGRNYDGLILSGALLSLAFFKDVEFKNCKFYGSRLENCEFLQCKFINCSFEFTTIEHTSFMGTTFDNCKWECSPTRDNKWSFCNLDEKTFYYANKEASNTLWQSTTPEITWEEVLQPSQDSDELPPPIPTQGLENPAQEEQSIWNYFLEKIAA